jgi:hypothetical protein
MPDSTSVDASIHATGELAGALQDMLRQMIGNIIGAPSQDKEGRPLRDVCYMQMPLGLPINPRDFFNPWAPEGRDTSGDIQDDGKQAASSAQNATPDGKLTQSLRAARRTAQVVDQMLRVTGDGTYRPFNASQTISSAYEAVVTKGQGIPAPPLPDDIQKRVDEAQQILYVFDDAGVIKGKTKAYKTYQSLKLAYADAQAEYANAFAAAMSDSSLGQVWPVASKSKQAAVDNAYDDWRSSDADKIENALDTINSVGGSIGEHFLSKARNLYDAWSLGLAGAVAAKIPYSEVLPSNWYDPTAQDNGFTQLKASASAFQSYSASQSSQFASSWYSGQSSSTGGSAGGMVFGITFGGSAEHSDSSQQSGSNSSGSESHQFSSSMSGVEISFEYGLCNIYRPWLLSELFVIDGWYLPNEKDKVVSDGTVAGQTSEDDAHLLPMIPTQFLVVRNVKIKAKGWGRAGTVMSQYCQNAQRQDQSSSTSVSGGAGFMFLGGTVSHDNADWSGDESESSSASGSWFFSGNDKDGELSINGCQIVGWVGEIIPVSPKVDGTQRP